jgi:hypothetical protein
MYLQVTTALALIHTLCNSLQHAHSFPRLLYLHQFSPGNGFQCRSFLSFCVHVLIGRWSSQPTPTFLTAVWRLNSNGNRPLLYNLSMDRTENASPNRSSIVASHSYRTNHAENTTSRVLHCRMLWICCPAMSMFADPFPSNGCLCWLDDVISTHTANWHPLIQTAHETELRLVFQDVMHCCLVCRYQCWKGICHLLVHFSTMKMAETVRFLWKTGTYFPNDTASKPSRVQS